MGGGRGETLVAYDSGSDNDDDDPTMPRLITHEPKRELRGALDAYGDYSSDDDTELTGERELREALGAATRPNAAASDAKNTGSEHERELREALDAVTGPDDGPLIDVAPCAYIWSTLVMLGARISNVFREKPK